MALSYCSGGDDDRRRPRQRVPFPRSRRQQVLDASRDPIDVRHHRVDQDKIMSHYDVGHADALLRAGAPLLLARLRASPEAGRDQALALLEQLSGEHYADIETWTRWVTSVQGPGPG